MQFSSVDLTKVEYGAACLSRGKFVSLNRVIVSQILLEMAAAETSSAAAPNLTTGPTLSRISTKNFGFAPKRLWGAEEILYLRLWCFHTVFFGHGHFIPENNSIGIS